MSAEDDDFPSDDDAPDAPPRRGVPKTNQRTLRIAEPGETAPETWRKALFYNQEGALTKDPGNAALILCHDDRWAGAIRYDEFCDRVRWSRDAPALGGMTRPRERRALDSQAVTYVQHWLRKNIGPAFSREATKEALMMAAQLNSFHPVREYLNGLAWDGTRRVEKWLATYMGSAEDRYHSEVGRMWLVSAVARVMMPGCKADYLLVLEGKQGKRKSSALRALAGEWTLEGLPDLRDQPRAASQIQGKWICEIPELHAIKGASVTLVKQWTTTQVDSFRAAYAEFQKDYPRQCIFAATTNEERYLIDATGGRRFWPVKCGEIALDALSADRDQLWAEALQIFEGGRACSWRGHGAWSWWPRHDDEELQTALAAAQDARFDEDEWSVRIGEWLLNRTSATTAELLAGPLNIEPGKWGRPEQTRAGSIMRRLGWEMREQRKNGIKERRYYRPEQAPGT